METLIRVNCSAIECTSLSPSAPIWQDILAQAMTGELLAAMNYTSLSEICDDPDEVADALEHAKGNGGMRRRSLPRAARSEWTSPITSTPSIGSGCAKHSWSCIAERDFIGCLIVQEIMLESFAVASYARVGKSGAGQSWPDLCPHRGGGRGPRRSRHVHSQSGACPGSRSASTTRCTGCISM